MDESERKTLADIEQYGCSVMHVHDPDERLPPFSYSIGVSKSSGAPEVVVVGLSQPLAHFIVNEYNDRVRAGEVFRVGHRYGGFIEGFDVLVVAVERKHYPDYFGYNLWLYQSANFEVLQLMYPNTSGVWPWQDQADQWFRARQPLLGKVEGSAL